jgi:hypothetical protein
MGKGRYSKRSQKAQDHETGNEKVETAFKKIQKSFLTGLNRLKARQ